MQLSGTPRKPGNCPEKCSSVFTASTLVGVSVYPTQAVKGQLHAALEYCSFLVQVQNKIFSTYKNKVAEISAILRLLLFIVCRQYRTAGKA